MPSELLPSFSIFHPLFSVLLARTQHSVQSSPVQQLSLVLFTALQYCTHHAQHRVSVISRTNELGLIFGPLVGLSRFTALTSHQMKRSFRPVKEDAKQSAPQVLHYACI